MVANVPVTAVIMAVLIAVCGCGTKTDSTDSAPAVQNNGTAQTDAGTAKPEGAARSNGEAAQTAGTIREPAAEQAHIAHRYASKEEGRELLLSNENYYAGFSQNDLDFKMQKKGASMEEYKAFAVEQVEDFTQEEIRAADTLFAEMEQTLADNGYTLPPLDEIVLVKTTMAEECYAAAYTHGT